MTVQWENEKGDLLVRLKEKEGEISRLSKDVDRVGEQLQERYSLPERVN